MISISSQVVGINEIKMPEVLYKYRNWDNPLHKTILENCELYLASPLDFEDPLDCRVPRLYPNKKDLFQFFLLQSKQENPNFTRSQHRDFAKKWSKQSPLAVKEKLQSKVESLRTKVNRSYGVLSMTVDPDNLIMWEKYANSDCGFCVGFNSRILRRYVAGGGEIAYVDKLPLIPFNASVEEEFCVNIMHKERKWSFEKEYRFTKNWYLSEVSVSDRTVMLPPESVVEIILGKNMVSRHREEIKRIAKEKYPTARLIER